MPSDRPIHIEIASNDRVFVCGKTGSGKSYLMRKLLRQIKRVIVIDSKNDLEWGLEPATEEAWKRLENGEPGRIRVTKPGGAAAATYWDEQLTRAYQMGNVTIYVDEAAQIQSGAQASEIVADIWQRGRAFGVGGWAASQRPAWIPKLFISEAEHVFMFRLVLASDREYMARIVGEEVKEPIPPEDRHGFWYYSIERDHPVYIDKLPAQFGGDEESKKVEVSLEREH